MTAVVVRCCLRGIDIEYVVFELSRSFYQHVMSVWYGMSHTYHPRILSLSVKGCGRGLGFRRFGLGLFTLLLSCAMVCLMGGIQGQIVGWHGFSFCC